MRKIIASIGLLAILSSCEKDCEKNHSATLVVSNAKDEMVLLKTDNGNIEIQPGHKKSIEIDLYVPGETELIYQGVVSYSSETTPNKFEQMVVVYNQCEKTEITIK